MNGTLSGETEQLGTGSGPRVRSGMGVSTIETDIKLVFIIKARCSCEIRETCGKCKILACRNGLTFDASYYARSERM